VGVLRHYWRKTPEQNTNFPDTVQAAFRVVSLVPFNLIIGPI